MYDEKTILQAFTVYAELTKSGVLEGELFEDYTASEDIRRLIEQFVKEVECTTIVAGEKMFLIPLTRHSTFHYSNETMKRKYLKGQPTNADLYLFYFATLVLFGEFYNSYATSETTIDFLRIDEWVRSMNQRIAFLKEHDLETLAELEMEYSYNWLAIVEKWDGLDDLKETVKKQVGNTQSRLSFLDSVCRFLISEGLAKWIGEGELALTEKAKSVIQSYFMEYEYNRAILDFLYAHELNKEVEE